MSDLMTSGHDEPCEHCGRKPNKCRCIVHKADCPVITGVTPEVKAPELPGKFQCCGQPMLRPQDGINPVICRHSRPLYDDCGQCRQIHHGILEFRCVKCRRVVRDAPHLASAQVARVTNAFARKIETAGE